MEMPRAPTQGCRDGRRTARNDKHSGRLGASGVMVGAAAGVGSVRRGAGHLPAECEDAAEAWCSRISTANLRRNLGKWSTMEDQPYTWRHQVMRRKLIRLASVVTLLICAFAVQPAHGEWIEDLCAQGQQASCACASSWGASECNQNPPPAGYMCWMSDWECVGMHCRLYNCYPWTYEFCMPLIC